MLSLVSGGGSSYQVVTSAILKSTSLTTFRILDRDASVCVNLVIKFAE